ncbi:CATRA conflict system CASPASE/TPR repeat-associated protein [Kitasatospora sp. NPDC092039]|uniref:CATRA conflict system CASPASE/TPR repeat-associated protein n=1 Tax=Kitasatospora sp. NPDC092039 TaxID=3364086 RepID=UPI00381BA781
MSTEVRFAREALQLHYFMDVQQLTGPGRTVLDALWSACGRIGMDRPVPSTGDMVLPHTIDASSSFHTVRSRRSSGPGVFEARVYVLGGIAGLVVMLAPPDASTSHGMAETATIWADLERAWDGAYTPPAQGGVNPLIGSVRIYRALADASPGAALDLDVVAGRLAGIVPGAATDGTDRISERLSLPAELSMREVTSRGAGEDHVDRTFVTTTRATDADEASLDAWSWFDVRSPMTPVTRYLLHAAAVRDQYGIRRAADPGLTRRRTALREDGQLLLLDCHRLLSASGYHRRAARRELARWEELAERAHRLLLEDGIAADRELKLRTMGRTIGVHSAAMTAALSTPADPSPGVLFSDAECATRLADVLEEDAFSFGVERERVKEAARIATESATQRLQSHQQYLSLVQTSVIGGLLMALTAVQTLGFRLPLAEHVQGPFIALLATLAVSLPVVITRRWSGGNGGRPGAVFEIAGLAGAGAAVGWLFARGAGHGGWSTAMTAAFAVAGAVLLGTGGAWHARRAIR